MGRNYADFTGDKNPNFKTGLLTAGTKKSVYNSWCNMKQRCTNPKNPKYHRYGGRGIDIAQEWMTIQGFWDWAQTSGWEEGLTIDRIDNDKGYCPENCRWVTAAINSKKKRTTKITFEQAKQIRERIDSGENEYDLAREYGVVNGTIWFIKNRVTHILEDPTI
jgi:hypothetical protein